MPDELPEIIVNISLILEIIILILLIIGSEYAYKKQYIKHGWMTVVAVTLHTISVLSIMIPSIVEESNLLGEITSAGIVTQLHVISGTAAWILGIASIVWWGFKKTKAHVSLPSHLKRKWVMRVIFIVWLVALISGIILHLFYM